MNFRGRRSRDEPEINLIPLIDVLLVILIFLAASTSFSRFSELSVTLPTASRDAQTPLLPPVTITVAADGRYAVNGKALPQREVEQLAQSLRSAIAGRPDPSVIIDADAAATHQSVIGAMEAARQAGIARVGFTTRSAPGGRP